MIRPFRLRRSALPRVVVGALLALLVACSDGSGQAPDEANSRLSITNDGGALGARIEILDEDVPVAAGAGAGIGPVGGGAGAGVGGPAYPLELRLYAEIDSPVVEGEIVQATMVEFRSSDRAVASYNMAGPLRLGAVDWLMSVRSRRPRLRSQVVFNDVDINAVTTDGRYVYTAAATNAPDMPYPAMLERIWLRNKWLRIDRNLRVPLTSFAATSVMTTDDEVYATFGNTGGVVALDRRNDLFVLGSYALDDARWAVWDREFGRVVVVQGTPGRVAVFEEGVFPNGSMNLLATWPFPGADVPESKTAADIAGDKLYIAAGPEGVQIMCLNDGSVVGSVPRPDPASLGLDPAVVVTNAVSVDDDLMFISNGEAGVYVARSDEDFDETGCDPPRITMIGQLQFDDLQSVNHVAHRRNTLLVAAGLGGVKVVRIFDDEDSDD